LGTFPNIEHAPDIPYHLLTEKHFLFDLVYNPPKTLFLQRGEEHGAIIQNGYDMLVYQAEASWDIWNG
jgi:shikimate dehydrogenase